MEKYTQIENEILEGIVKVGLSKSELMVFLVLIRKLNGFHKDEDAISISQLVEATGLSNRSVISGLQQLQRMKICSQVSKGTAKGRPSIWGINKSVLSWQPMKRTSLVKFPTSTSAKQGKKPMKISSHTKDNTKESTKEIGVSPMEFGNSLVTFIVKEFERIWEYKPASYGRQNPRMQAQNFLSRFKTLIKKDVGEKKMKDSITVIMEKMHKAEWGSEVTRIKALTDNLFKVIKKMKDGED